MRSRKAEAGLGFTQHLNFPWDTKSDVDLPRLSPLSSKFVTDASGSRRERASIWGMLVIWIYYFYLPIKNNTERHKEGFWVPSWALEGENLSRWVLGHFGRYAYALIQLNAAFSTRKRTPKSGGAFLRFYMFYVESTRRRGSTSHFEQRHLWTFHHLHSFRATSTTCTHFEWRGYPPPQSKTSDEEICHPPPPPHLIRKEGISFCCLKLSFVFFLPFAAFCIFGKRHRSWNRVFKCEKGSIRIKRKIVTFVNFCFFAIFCNLFCLCSLMYLFSLSPIVHLFHMLPYLFQFFF